MAITAEQVAALKNSITADGGLISKITELANAPEAERSKKIIPLIGSIIDLVMTAIQAAM